MGGTLQGVFAGQSAAFPIGLHNVEKTSAAEFLLWVTSFVEKP
jgi:hypothetical protein